MKRATEEGLFYMQNITQNLPVDATPSGLREWGGTYGENLPLYRQNTPTLLLLVKALAIGEFDHVRPYGRTPEKKRLYKGVKDEIGSNPEQWLLEREACIIEKLRDDYKENRYLLDNEEYGDILSAFTPSYYRVQEETYMVLFSTVCMNSLKFLRWSMDNGYENAIPPTIKMWLSKQERVNAASNTEADIYTTLPGVTPEEAAAWEEAIDNAAGGNKKKLRAVLLAAQGKTNAELETELPLVGEQNVSRYKSEGRALAIGLGLPDIWGRGPGVPPPSFFLTRRF